MGHINQLVEQQILAFQLHQRHVDELSRQRRRDTSRPAARLPIHSEPHAEGFMGVMQVIGLQFEKALTAILETGRH